jgi:phospholipid/cholesterol/gamma-HCH transport system substrate-binding protein
MAKTTQLEVKVGVFVLLAAAVLVSMGLLLSHVRLSPSLLAYADFNYTGALQQGAAVRLSGIRIGQVQSLKLLDPAASPPPARPHPALGRKAVPVVRAELSLDTSAAPLLHAGSTFAVATAALIGEAFLELVPGPGSAPLPTEAAVRGIDALRLYDVSQQVAQLLQAAAPLLGPAPLPGALPTPGDAPPLAQSIGRIASRLADAFDQEPAAVAHVLAHLDVGSQAASEVLQGLQRAMGPGVEMRDVLQATRTAALALRQHLPGLLVQSKQVLGAAAALGQRADAQFTDAAVAGLVHDAGEGAAHLKAVSAAAQRLIQALEAGHGSLGGLLQDPQIYLDLRDLMQDLKKHPWKVLWK